MTHKIPRALKRIILLNSPTYFISRFLQRANIFALDISSDVFLPIYYRNLPLAAYLRNCFPIFTVK